MPTTSVNTWYKKKRFIIPAVLLLVVLSAGIVALLISRQPLSNQQKAATPTQPIPSAEVTPTPAPSYQVARVDKSGQIPLYYIYSGTLHLSDFMATKAEAKAILAEIAKQSGSTDFVARILADERLAAEKSTMDTTAFSELCKTKCIAYYTGGVDGTTGATGNAESAYTISWYPAASKSDTAISTYVSTENWKPSL